MGGCSSPPPILLRLPTFTKTLTGLTATTSNNKKRKQKLIMIVSSSSSSSSSCGPRLTRRQLVLTLLISSGTAPISMARSADVFTTEAERAASSEVSRRVGEAVELLEKGREFQAQGDYVQALQYFTRVVREYKDFALSEYARVGRALALYEVGDKDEAIAEMEDVSISLKGSPEVHAALAAALYSDKHASVLAENQFTIATLLDPKYTDLAYVKDTKHWPPSLVRSLQDFITLS